MIFINFFILFNLFSIYHSYSYHGTQIHFKYGATCREFLERNNLYSCCNGRDDECYMNHFNTRCYCDQFCGTSNSSDCCPDVKRINNVNQCPVTIRTCYKNSKFYSNGYSMNDNCNRCRCHNGVWSCQKRPCLINMDLLEDINSKNYGWIATNYSQFWSKTLDFGYLNYLGVTIPERRQKPMTSDHEQTLVKFYDFRNEGYFNNSIKNQGMCPSSWAFSIIDVITDRMSKFTNKFLDKTPSVEHLVSCHSNNKNKNKCSPLPVDLGWSLAKNWDGIVDEECYPSNQVESGFVFRCKIINSKCPGKNLTQIFRISKAYPVVPKTENIMREILNNGPVQMVFRIYDDFFMYKSGVYTPTPKARSQSQYHAVKVLGWGSQKGVDYWLAANSWGPNWGENGYFKIRRKSLLTEIGKHVYGAWVYV